MHTNTPLFLGSRVEEFESESSLVFLYHILQIQ